MLYRSTKYYGASEGLSCVFRQWKATHSHCQYIHGYALCFRFVFATRELDERHWCYDFGAMKQVKAWLHENFDHTLIAASDDPKLDVFRQLEASGLAQLRILPAVGCEAVAKHVFDYVSEHVGTSTGKRVWLERVDVQEHSGNSASYEAGEAHA